MTARIKVAVLVDLVRRRDAGGHVKCWERFADAARGFAADLDLTIFFSAKAPFDETQGNVRLVGFRPVCSTASIPFLGHVPDHTDLAPWHHGLSVALRRGAFDVIHTTDAFFAYSKTAERLARALRVPLVTSLHTDTPRYAEIFTARTIEHIFGRNRISRHLIEGWHLPGRERRKKLERLARHCRAAQHVLVSNEADEALMTGWGLGGRTSWLRLGCDREMFRPDGAARAQVRARLSVPPESLLVLFAGRLDEGKNIYRLGEGVAKARAAGADIHLIAAGEGPGAAWLSHRLGQHVSCPGVLPPADLAQAYAGADLFVLPSEVETWSLAAIEALASGTPVMAARSSGAGRFIGAGHSEMAGQVIDDSSNAEVWAEALHTAAMTPGLVARWRENIAHAATPWIVSWGEAMEKDLLPIWRAARARSLAKTA